MLQPLWTSSQVYSTWTPAHAYSRLSHRHEKPKKTKHNSCFLGFACFCCKAVGCLWVSGKKWLCLYRQSLLDDNWQMLTEHAAQTRVLTVLVNSNTALCRWPKLTGEILRWLNIATRKYCKDMWVEFTADIPNHRSASKHGVGIGENHSGNFSPQYLQRPHRSHITLLHSDQDRGAC